MWYMPYVRVRRAVLIYAFIVIGISLAAVALRLFPGAIHANVQQQMHLSDVHIDISMILGGSAALVGGFATVLGLNLAAENDGHLELAWTKPVSRQNYALGVFAVDIVAMAACILLTLICAVAVVDVDLGHQAVTLLSSHAFIRALMFCGFPLCIYAWVTALSASLKRNRGSVAGLFWPLMLVLVILKFVQIPAVHFITTVLNTFNPIEIYFTNSRGPSPGFDPYLSGWFIAAALLAAAIVQWRRLEI